MSDKERRDEDTELLNLVFNKNPEEVCIQEELALPVHEGNGTTKSIWNWILYPYYVWKQKRREAEIRRNIFNNK